MVMRPAHGQAAAYAQKAPDLTAAQTVVAALQANGMGNFVMASGPRQQLQGGRKLTSLIRMPRDIPS
jgi:hypothetical protein